MVLDAYIIEDLKKREVASDRPRLRIEPVELPDPEVDEQTEEPEEDPVIRIDLASGSC